jgi:hypothetical protein
MEHPAAGDPANLMLCRCGTWNTRMPVETVLSMPTLVCHFKKVMHRRWAYFQARLAFTLKLRARARGPARERVAPCA